MSKKNQTPFARFMQFVKYCLFHLVMFIFLFALPGLARFIGDQATGVVMLFYIFMWVGLNFAFFSNRAASDFGD